MKNHTILKRAIAAGLLSATLAAPAALISAGTAVAKPREVNCAGIAKAIDSSMYMADRARDQGNIKAAREHMREAALASANYQRHCLT